MSIFTLPKSKIKKSASGVFFIRKYGCEYDFKYVTLHSQNQGILAFELIQAGFYQEFSCLKVIIGPITQLVRVSDS